MKITLQEHQTVIHNTYLVEGVSWLGPFYYTELINENDKVIDCFIRNFDGEDLYNPALLEEIRDHLEKTNPLPKH